MRRPQRRRQPPGGGLSNDNLGRVAHHRGTQHQLFRGNRRGNADKKRVPVRRGPCVVRMAMQSHVQANWVLVVRRLARMMVIAGQV